MVSKFLATKLEKGNSMIEQAWIFAMSKSLSIKSQKGVTMIEYALIAALVAVAAIGAITTLGGNVSALFTKVAGNLK